MYGCVVFILALIGSLLFYVTIGGLIADYIMQLRGIKGMDAHTFVMTYFFVYVPFLTFATTVIISIIAMFRESGKANHQSNLPNNLLSNEEKEDEA